MVCNIYGEDCNSRHKKLRLKQACLGSALTFFIRLERRATNHERQENSVGLFSRKPHFNKVFFYVKIMMSGDCNLGVFYCEQEVECMKITKNIQGWWVAAAFLATVVLLFGGQAINAKLRVENPLNQHLKAMKTVTGFKVKPVGDGLQLDLKLKQNRNLPQVLNTAIKEVEFYYKKPVTELVIGSHSNPQLEQMRYQLSFNLEEALVSGRYVQLKTAFEAYNRPGTLAKVYLERRFIYLQLETGKDYLYQATPRSDRPVAGVDQRTEGGMPE
jgi:hypothetical protein